MNTVLKSVLIVGSLSLLGAVCLKTADTNLSVAQNSNVGVDTNSIVNTNVSANTNISVNTNSAMNTSGWLVYTDSQYGFSFSYPSTWTVEKKETQLNSRLFTNKKIYVLHVQNETGEVVATLLPEGQLDHGLPEDGITTNLTVSGKDVVVHDFGDYVVYFFTSYPSVDSQFRIESRTTDTTNQEEVNQVVKTLTFFTV